MKVSERLVFKKEGGGACKVTIHMEVVLRYIQKSLNYRKPKS